MHCNSKYWKPEYALAPVPIELFAEVNIEWKKEDEIDLTQKEHEDMQWCGESPENIAKYIMHNHPDCVGFLTYCGNARGIKKYTKTDA